LKRFSPAGARAGRLVAATTLGTLILSGSAAAAVKQQVSAAKAVARSCHESYVGGAGGAATVRAKAPADGLVLARLAGAGDWDLGVFDAKTKRYVAGSAGFRSNELAEGFVRKGQKLVVQACRYRGDAASARVSVSFLEAGGSTKSADEKVQVVDVAAKSLARRNDLQKLGLDLTEHGDRDSVEVVLHGRADAAKLKSKGFDYDVRIADLEARSEANRAADRRYAAAVEESGLPSGSTGYRHLADYELEMKELALRYPSMVKPVTLNHKSVLGRDVNGIEIARNAAFVNDGKPIFLNMGVHHAREWPSSEHAIEWAYDLLTNYGSSDRTTRLVNATRNIVVPIVNVDGFNISREAQDFPPSTEFGLFSYEMKRKNCDISDNTPAFYRTGTCDNNNAGRLRGTDPNRNYGGFWGGGGASTNWSSDTYRGDGPFSEPETRNIRELQATRNITNLITNHTFSNLLLRPPAIADVGFPHDEPQYAALGARMASHNDYANIPSFGLYDTSGGTEDWTFWTAGSLGFTFEIGPDEFHPPYQNGVVAEYLGLAPAAGAGQGGNREAYYEMLESTLDKSLHSVIEGKAPEGWRLNISKSFKTQTSPVWNDDGGVSIGDPISFDDTLSYDLDTKGNRFEWHVNPSTRPVVAGRLGRDAEGPPQGAIALANPAGQPAEYTGSNPLSGPHEEVPFTVQGRADGVDNGRMTVHIEWGNAATDWDLYVYNSAGQIVTQSAAFGDTNEDAVLLDPPAGTYRAVLINYDQVNGAPYDDWSGGAVRFESPRPTTFGPKEAWKLTCTSPGGKVKGQRDVIVDRGQSVDVGKICQK
jgi:murein tripeptide amidase MpaA